MADILNQNEIDELLNSSAEAEGTADETTGQEVEEEIKEKIKEKSKTKTFTYTVDKNKRFPVPYHSPVVKKENMLFNPNPGSQDHSNKIIVRTLDNYVEHIENKK